LELTSIEPQDADGQAIPGQYLVVTDAQDQPVYTFSNQPPTTTTTTTAPAGVTTTTLRGATVTTTTLPAECSPGATFVSAGCRLAKLIEAVRATADGPVAVKLVTKVSAAQQAVTAAEQALATSHKQVVIRIGKALNALAAYKNVLKTRAAKKALA